MAIGLVVEFECLATRSAFVVVLYTACWHLRCTLGWEASGHGESFTLGSSRASQLAACIGKSTKIYIGIRVGSWHSIIGYKLVQLMENCQCTANYRWWDAHCRDHSFRDQCIQVPLSLFVGLSINYWLANNMFSAFTYTSYRPLLGPIINYSVVSWCAQFTY